MLRALVALTAPDPEHAAKLEARRKAYALKVWKADPKTQAQQQELDAARAQLQRLQDGGKKLCKIDTSPNGTRKLSQWVPVPPLVALWQLLVLKDIDFGIILGPLWRLWAVDDFVHL